MAGTRQGIMDTERRKRVLSITYKILIPLIFTSHVCFATILSAASDSNDLIVIKLVDMQPAKVGYHDFGSSAGNESSMFPIQEEIEKLPSDCNVVETFHLLLQPSQYFAHLQQNDEQIRKSFEEHEHYGSGVTLSEHLEKHCTTAHVDGIISVCVVKDKNNNEFVIFDKNNDEDFTNEEFLSYSFIYKHPFSNEDPQENNSLIVKANVDIYDGKQVRKVNVLLRCTRIERNDGSFGYIYSIDNVKYGSIKIGNDNHPLIITNLSPQLDYDSGSEIQIDLNNDSKFDGSDLRARLFQPFTVKGKTYEMHEIGRMGNFVTLKKSDAPPVEIGCPAPDIKCLTLDSKEFVLSKNKGKMILLDFWATWCGPCVGETRYLKDAYSLFKGKDFEIIGIAINDDVNSVKAYIQKNGIKWPQICDKAETLRKLYQFDGIPALFLIDADGTIVSKGSELRGDRLVQTLKKHLRE